LAVVEREARGVRGPEAEIRIVRFASGDVEPARRMFGVMNQVFEVAGEELSDGYVERLLVRKDFWALGAFVDDRVVGGVTAHELPMTRAEHGELFVYDLAVLPELQRHGIGGLLVRTLVQQAAEHDIDVVFVPADNDDDHALAFYEAIGGRPAAVTMYDLGAG
jgi:aminoglycoside 3-N-acetyltransferase I